MIQENLWRYMGKMIEFVIEGHDGSAKTPIAEGVRDKLDELGYSVSLYEPFQLVKEKIPEEDIYFYWGDGRAKEAVNIIKGMIQEIRDNNKANIVLYDRHWMTVFSEIDSTPLVNGWVDFPPTFFLKVKPEITRQRNKFSYDIPFTSNNQQIQGYFNRYNQLAEKYSEHIVGNFEVLKNRIDLTIPIDLIVNCILKRL